MNKSEICRKNGYHMWSDYIESISETFLDMTLSCTCSVCGATFEATGDWDNEVSE